VERWAGKASSFNEGNRTADAQKKKTKKKREVNVLLGKPNREWGGGHENCSEWKVGASAAEEWWVGRGAAVATAAARKKRDPAAVPTGSYEKGGKKRGAERVSWKPVQAWIGKRSPGHQRTEKLQGQPLW